MADFHDFHDTFHLGAERSISLSRRVLNQRFFIEPKCCLMFWSLQYPALAAYQVVVVVVYERNMKFK